MKQIHTTSPGAVFGRWTVLRQCPNDGRYWFCRCECGTERRKYLREMIVGHSRSCGCLRSEIMSETQASHRMTGSETYQSWSGMLTRCYNKRRVQYKDYGGRGITVCDRWRSFENFLADMGPRPDGHTLDRINNDGNYEPGNCRWADKVTQARNARSTTPVTIGGETKPIAEWAESAGLNYNTFISRLMKGWTGADLFRKPSQVRRA